MHLESSPFFVALIVFLLKLSHPLKQRNPFMWTGISRSSLASLCSRRLWSRSYWFLWDSGVSAFVLNVLAWTIQESHVKVLLIFVRVISEDEVARLPGLFLEPNDFAHDVCGDEVFARVAFLSGSQSCSALLGFVHAACEDGVGACTREILVFYRFFHSNCKKTQSKTSSHE